MSGYNANKVEYYAFIMIDSLLFSLYSIHKKVKHSKINQSVYNTSISSRQSGGQIE